MSAINDTLSTEECINLESDFAAHTYHPMPVCFEKASGVNVWDPEGKHYFDFLSAYSAVNQGHCHPKIVEALTQQATKCTLSSRAFYNNVFPQFAKYVTSFFGYDMVLPMNTGAEAVETSIKLARKWGYKVKKIPNNEAIIICCEGCFHGRTAAAVAVSNDPTCYEGFGPLLPGFLRIPFNDVGALAQVLERHGDKVAGFIVEPIQGEAGVVVPHDNYLRDCHDLCKKHNVLLIADEIQTGLCRTGRMLCSDWDEIKPDVVLLGKAISGGILPLSVVLANKQIMLVLKPGEHGSTYGGNPLASAVGIAALQVLKDENLAERANTMGEYFREKLSQIAGKFTFVEGVRGRGLLNALLISPELAVGGHKHLAWEICVSMSQRGLLAKPTHDYIIRLAPPLVISQEDLDKCIRIIEDTLEEFDTKLSTQSTTTEQK